jgi:hypothetical protein
MERKEESGDAGQGSGRQKDGGQAIQAFPGNHSKHSKEPREDANQTQKHVKQGERRHAEDHGFPLFGVKIPLDGSG